MPQENYHSRRRNHCEKEVQGQGQFFSPERSAQSPEFCHGWKDCHLIAGCNPSLSITTVSKSAAAEDYSGIRPQSETNELQNQPAIGIVGQGTTAIIPIGMCSLFFFKNTKVCWFYISKQNSFEIFLYEPCCFPVMMLYFTVWVVLHFQLQSLSGSQKYHYPCLFWQTLY